MAEDGAGVEGAARQMSSGSSTAGLPFDASPISALGLSAGSVGGAAQPEDDRQRRSKSDHSAQRSPPAANQVIGAVATPTSIADVLVVEESGEVPLRAEPARQLHRPVVDPAGRPDREPRSGRMSWWRGLALGALIPSMLGLALLWQGGPDAWTLLRSLLDQSAPPSSVESPEREDQPLADLTRRTVLLKAASSAQAGRGRPTVGFVGSGNYATGVLIPAFAKTKARLKSVASSGGVSGMHAGKKHGFEETTTDAAGLIQDPAIDTVVITTRHDSHARFVCDILKAGKHVFVEKPLALDRAHLAQIREVYEPLAEQGRAPLLMVGFNRRFSPLIEKAKALLAGVREPKSFVMTVNAGEIPADHWTQDTAIGGGPDRRRGLSFYRSVALSGRGASDRDAGHDDWQGRGADSR